MDGFEWDAAKAESNYRKHGVSFEAATEVFSDHFAVERYDPASSVQGEERFLITGAAVGRVLTVVYTERGRSIRIISARRASKGEHDDYYRQNSAE